MRIYKILGILLLIAGIGLILGSNYIAEQVAEGKLKIESGQKFVDKENWLFKQTPVTKPIGNIFTKGQQKQIDEGSAMASSYETLSTNLKYGGMVLIGLGIVAEIVSIRKRRKARKK